MSNGWREKNKLKTSDMFKFMEYEIENDAEKQNVKKQHNRENEKKLEI